MLRCNARFLLLSASLQVIDAHFTIEIKKNYYLMGGLLQQLGDKNIAAFLWIGEGVDF